MRRYHARKALVAVFVLLVPGVGQAGKGRVAVGIEEALCNTLAAEPSDPKRRPGIVSVAWRDVNAAKAIPACRMAVAVAPGDARLQFQLARALHKAGSEGNRPDAQEARALYRAAAEAGHIGAMNNLGMMLSGGVGGDRNDVEALAWFHKAAAAGDAIAMYNLGGMIANGRGGAPDLTEGTAWYRRAAQAGHDGAMYQLGILLDSGLRVATVVSRKVGDVDNGTSVASPSQTSVALRALLPSDDAAAVSWYRKAANAGHVGAMSRLGRMLENGRGTARNDVEAVAWYRKAAEAGNPAAMLGLGQMLMAGRGAERNEIEARIWLNTAAAQSAAVQTAKPLFRVPMAP